VRKEFMVAVLCAILSPVLWGGVVDEPPITQDELVRRTQELFDAVAPGNAEPFKKYFADDAMFFDEKGRDMDKAALVKDHPANAERLFRHDQAGAAEEPYRRQSGDSEL
jgi:hypothetical protein